MSQSLSPSGSSRSNDSSMSRLASFERVRVMANYLELSAFEYIQRCSGDSGFHLDDSTIPLFYILSCWKLLWCLSINELIGESLRNMIEENFTFRTDIGGSDSEHRKLLSIPEMSEGEVSRYAMAYSPIFRVVLGVLRWLRWESRVNPHKQNDVVFRDTYYMDYPESRILWKNLKNQKRFYSLDWALNVDKSVISQSDKENVEEIFKVAFMLLRKGCRMQLDTFLRDKAKAHWIICIMDGMDSYLYPEKQSDHYVDLSEFVDILPKVDDMWINYNEEDNEMDMDEMLEGTTSENQFVNTLSSINKELALNDTLFKVSFEFIDLMERSLIFPASSDSTSSDDIEIETEGNINRPLLFRYLRQLVSENRKTDPMIDRRLGEWELSFYSMLCGEFDQLYSIAGDNFDKLFALFHAGKINIFNGWADFLESRTQSGRNHIFLGKSYPKKRLENALFNRLKLLTKDLYPEITSDYLPEDCESTSEYNLVRSIQSKMDNECNSVLSEDDETQVIGYNSSCFCYDQNSKGVVYMMDLEKQLVDSLIDSISCLNLEKDKNSIESHFFELYLGIIVSTLSAREHSDDLVRVLEQFMNFVSNLSNDTPNIGSIKAFISQLTIAHLEVENSQNHNIRNYSVSIFDEFDLASLPSMDCFDDLEPSQASIQLDVFSDSIYLHPLHNLSESQKDKFVSQYLSHILESNGQSLDVFMIMLEYSSEECKLEYILKVISSQQNNLEIPNFQKLVYNLITQFPGETMQVTMTLQDQLYGDVHAFFNKDSEYSLEALDSLISYLEFIVLLFGTIFQFLIIRQDYSPSSESIFKVLQCINRRGAKANDAVNYNSDYLKESLKSLEQSLLSENPCNQTTSEVVIGLFFLCQLNPLCLTLLTLEISKLSGTGDIDTLEYNQFVLNVTRSNACIQEFIIPLVLEPIMIRLITVLASNSENIGPNYSRYKISKLKESRSLLQASSWEKNLANIFSIGNFIHVQNVFIPFSPIKFASSQLTFFKVLRLIKVYHESVEKLWECVKVSEQENFQNENFYQFGIGNSIKQREPLQSPVISPGNSLLSSPFNKFTSPASNNQRRSSLQLLNLEKQIDGVNQSISHVISNIEVILQNWLVFDTTSYYSPQSENSRDKESQEVGKTENSQLSGFLPEYCSFDKDNFGLETFSVEHSNNKELLKRSRFINTQKLFDQLILTIIFHHDIELFSTKKSPLFPRRSIDSVKDQQNLELKSVSFLNNILRRIEHSNWIFTDWD